MTLHAHGWMARCLVVSLGIAAAGFAKIRSTWFDVNPSQSNDGDNGASGGRVNHVGAASDLSKIYAATEWGGLYQSFNQGNSWVRINTFTPSATWDVKVNPRNSQQVYATSFFDGRVNPQSGVSISNDGGTTWTAVNFARSNTLNCGNGLAAVPQRKTQPSAWQIAINPATASTVFVGTNCGLARTTDSGVNWTFIDPSPFPNDLAEQVYAVAVQPPQTVDVISDNGHFRSTDNGANWTPIPAAPGPVAGNSGSLRTIAVSPQESYVLLASDQTDIFESDDGGNTWPYIAGAAAALRFCDQPGTQYVYQNQSTFVVHSTRCLVGRRQYIQDDCHHSFDGRSRRSAANPGEQFGATCRIARTGTRET